MRFSVLELSWRTIVSFQLQPDPSLTSIIASVSNHCKTTWLCDLTARCSKLSPLLVLTFKWSRSDVTRPFRSSTDTLCRITNSWTSSSWEGKSSIRNTFKYSIGLVWKLGSKNISQISHPETLLRKVLSSIKSDSYGKFFEPETDFHSIQNRWTWHIEIGALSRPALVKRPKRVVKFRNLRHTSMQTDIS